MSNVVKFAPVGGPASTRARRRMSPAAVVSRFDQPGEFAVPEAGADCEGLCMRVTELGDGGLSKTWLFRYRLDGKRSRLGLGSAAKVGLPEAMEVARRYRALVVAGIDPATHRADFNQTWREVIPIYMEEHADDFTNEKHRAQWTTSLGWLDKDLGGLKVGAVTVEQVAKALKPIWTATPETGRRLQARVMKVFDFAIGREWRTAGNPATTSLMIQQLGKGKRKKARHHPALAFEKASEFYREVIMQEGLAAYALRLVMFTVLRTSELLPARWPEFDLDEALWSVPGDRMKIKTEDPHYVPLPTQAVALLRELRSLRRPGESLLFPGMKEDKPLSNMCMLVLLKRMDYHKQVTPHGMRSAFKDWSRETYVELPKSGVAQQELTELSLAHNVGNAVVRAYGRRKLLELRRPLMQAWADHVSPPGAAIEQELQALDGRAAPPVFSKTPRPWSPRRRRLAARAKVDRQDVRQPQ